MNNNFPEDKEILEQLQKLTLERLRAMPKNTEIAIGSNQYTKTDLLRHVIKADELGKQIMTIQLEFLQDLASGEIYRNDNSGYPAQA